MTEYVKITENVTRYLEALRDQLRDARVPLAHAVPMIREYFRRQFETLGSEGGQSWAPLTASTMERRGGLRPLMLTGTLMASLTEEGATGLTKGGRSSSRAYGYVVLDAHSVRVGTKDPVANLLQSGTRKMVARDIEGEPPAPTVERWADLVADDLTRLTSRE